MKKTHRERVAQVALRQVGLNRWRGAQIIISGMFKIYRLLMSCFFLPAAHCQLPPPGRSLALNHIATSTLGGKLRARRRISPLNVYSTLAAVLSRLLNYYVCAYNGLYGP